MEKTKKAWINLLLLVATLFINTLGALGLINGLSQKQISDKYLTLITPSPSTFSIWSVIYSLLIISLIAMLIKKKDPYYESAISEISVLFWVSCILNIVWIVAFSYVLIELSVLFIFLFVITLSMICQKLLKIQEGKRFLLPLSFGIYTGWLFIATVVNASAALAKVKWNGFGLAGYIWAIIMLTLSVILIIFVLLNNRNAAFPLPIAWAYFGIFQFLKAPEGFRGQFGTLQLTAVIGMIVLVVAAAFQFYRNRFQIIPVLSSKK